MLDFSKFDGNKDFFRFLKKFQEFLAALAILKK